jgi:hypothetical protein
MMGRRLLGTGHAWEGLAAMLVLLVSLLLLLLLLKLVLLLLLLLLLVVVVVVRLLPWSTLIVRGSMRMTVAEAAPSAANEQGLKVDPPLLPDAEMVPETAYVPAGKTTTRDPECERGEMMSESNSERVKEAMCKRVRNHIGGGNKHAREGFDRCGRRVCCLEQQSNVITSR